MQCEDRSRRWTERRSVLNILYLYIEQLTFLLGKNGNPQTTQYMSSSGCVVCIISYNGRSSIESTQHISRQCMKTRSVLAVHLSALLCSSYNRNM